jgi:hypothetical protein
MLPCQHGLRDQRGATTMKRRVVVAGITLEVQADGADLWQPVEVLFSGCIPSVAEPEITIRHGPTPPAVPDRPPTWCVPELAVWLEADGVAARHASGATGRRFDDQIIVGGSDPSDSDPARAFRLVTQLPLIDALARHGRHAMHAAAVERDGDAVLVLGDSGAGKSTLAYAGSQGGWRIVADDLSLVGIDGVARVSGLPKPVHVPGNLLTLPPAGSRRLPDDERERWSLPPTAIAARGRYPIAAVVMLAHSTGRASAVEVPPSPTRLQMLIGSLPLAGLPHVVQAFFPIAAAVSRLPMWTYTHPARVEERVPAGIALLDSIVGEGAGLASDRQ